MTRFQPVDSHPNFSEQEHSIWRFWKTNNILQKYLNRNKNASKHFSFIDGPITANNPMGVHHAWGRTLKDTFQRYKNMQGFEQRFQNGFDCQGLWVEVEVEKEHKFKNKKDIERYGIGKFVEDCKIRAHKFADIQTEQSKRLGYFMDWENSYYTLSDENNYAIWAFLKKCFQDGNLYKGRDSVPWCPRCGTAISQHEILNEEYKEITHKTIVFRLPLKNDPTTSLLAWTTTPWTIPGNVALVVDPKLSYWKMKNVGSPEAGQIIIVNPTQAGSAEKEASLAVRLGLTDGWEKVEELQGSDLVGLEYTNPYNHLPAVREAFGDYIPRIVASDPVILQVDPSEGTGIVHIAPGAGTEDFRLGKKEQLPPVEQIDEAGIFLGGFGDFSGSSVQEVSSRVLQDLEEKEIAFKIFAYTHRYPTCWRCKVELVWRVVDEWYIAMDATNHKKAKNYRNRLKSTAQQAEWIPKFGLSRELDWLTNMHDWLISKKRYWGLALPIYECSCGNVEVIGSEEELKKRAVSGWDEFEGQSPHRPWVDKVKIECTKCKSEISRIPDVGNPWLDAGIVALSTLKYFTDKKYWNKWFPANFITECFPGQFKNWFYAQIAMSTIMEDKVPFETLLGHALVMDEHGEEMHKSKGNAIWFDDAVEQMGADIMRWLYLRQTTQNNLNFGYGPAEEVRRKFHLILWNSYKFVVTYAQIDKDATTKLGYTTVSQLKNLTDLDKWVLSRLHNTIKTVEQSLDKFATKEATQALESLVNEFSTWYIRRSRDRIGPTAENQQDKKTFYTVAYEVLVTLAKLLAPLTPYISESIYQNLKTFEMPESIHLCDWPTADEGFIDTKLEEQMKQAREVMEKGHSLRKFSGVKVRQPLASFATIKKEVSDEINKLLLDELNTKEIKYNQPKDRWDLNITPELELEGKARDMMREIQSLRRKKRCDLSELVLVEYLPEKYGDVVGEWGSTIARKTLVEKLVANEELSSGNPINIK